MGYGTHMHLVYKYNHILSPKCIKREMSQTEQSRTEKSRTEKPRTEKSRTEKSRTEKSQTEKSRTEMSQRDKSRTEKSRISKKEKFFRSRRNLTIGSHFIMQEDIISFHAQIILTTEATSIIIVILVKLHNFTFIQKENNVDIMVKMYLFTRIPMARRNMSFVLLSVGFATALFRQMR